MGKEIVYIGEKGKKGNVIRVAHTCCKDLGKILSQKDFESKRKENAKIVEVIEEKKYILTGDLPFCGDNLFESKPITQTPANIEFREQTLPGETRKKDYYQNRGKRGTTTKGAQYFKNQRKGK